MSHEVGKNPSRQDYHDYLCIYRQMNTDSWRKSTTSPTSSLPGDTDAQLSGTLMRLRGGALKPSGNQGEVRA